MASPVSDLLEQIKIIDTDTHIIEPYDLWTSRVSTQRWGNMVPHVEWSEAEQQDVWIFGDTILQAAAGSAMAGWREYPPGNPPRIGDAEPDTYDADLRLKRMDADGIHAQILYPNVQGFGTGRFAAMNDTDLMLACVKAYNDYLVDWSAPDRSRLIPVAALPFWDLDDTIKEMERAKSLGHKGFTFSTGPEFYGLPHLTDPHWDTVWAAAQDHDLSVNFHIGSGDRSAKDAPSESIGKHAKFASSTVKFFMGNVKGLADVIHADGIGLVVTRDGTVIRMRAGDTVYTPPGEDHWHGATDGNFMSHLALLEDAGHDNGTTWLEPVTDDQYRAANQH
jgi:predicted TIM-barrel fold metal-dependent hydrolase